MFHFLAYTTATGVKQGTAHGTGTVLTRLRTPVKSSNRRATPTRIGFASMRGKIGPRAKSDPRRREKISLFYRRMCLILKKRREFKPRRKN
jgi:hypothetical protein